MTARLAAVTGATGFLGVHLVRALHRSGWRVRVLARREPSAPGWGEAEPEIVRGDLFDAAAMDALVSGADAVFHVAGAIKAADRTGFLRVNEGGVIEACAALSRTAPAARMVLVSSLAAREPQLSDYAFSKRAGETAALAALPAAQVTIARPPAIYGPGDRETLTIFQAAAVSPILPVPSATARLALIHAEDAAAQIVQIADAPAGVYALADARPQGYGWREIFEAAATASGRRPRLIDAPPWLLPGLARAAGFIARMNGKVPILTEGKVREFLHPDWSVSPTELAPGRIQPRFTLADGFRDTLDWYCAAGWIRRPVQAKSPH